MLPRYRQKKAFFTLRHDEKFSKIFANFLNFFTCKKNFSDEKQILLVLPSSNHCLHSFACEKAAMPMNRFIERQRLQFDMKSVLTRASCFLNRSAVNYDRVASKTTKKKYHIKRCSCGRTVFFVLCVYSCYYMFFNSLMYILFL